MQGEAKESRGRAEHPNARIPTSSTIPICLSTTPWPADAAADALNPDPANHAAKALPDDIFDGSGDFF